MKTKRLVSFFLVISMLLSFRVSTAAAYENTYKNTGNQTADIVGVAQTQYGYPEETGGYTKYGDWYGNPYTDWCAMFVSWCANQAGISSSVIPKFSYCQDGLNWFKSKGQFKAAPYYGGSYTPKAGDLVFYDWDVNGTSNHVAIVTGSTSSTFNTIEGNLTDQVGKRTNFSTSSKYVMGFAVPAYNSSSNTDEPVVPDAEGQKYVITGDDLRIRKAPVNGETLGYLYKGDIVVVTKVVNGWGYITHNGINGYISLDYAKPYATVSSIKVTTLPTKTEYLVGDSFSEAGMVVTATYSDGSTKKVTGYTVSGFSSTSKGVKTIKVTYSGKTATFTVNVSEKFSTGTYKVTADELRFRAGPGTDYDVYTMIPNGTVLKVTEISGNWGKTKYGTHTGWVSMDYLVKSEEKTLSAIKIATKPSKLKYYIGDTFDSTGLTVQAVYSDSSTSNVTGYTVSKVSLTSVGEKTVTVSYSGKTASFTVSVAKPTITLSASKLDMYSTQTTIIEATTTPANQTVEWSSNSSAVKVSGGIVTAVKEGSATITAKFTYNSTSYSAQCTVKVGERPISSISVKTAPDKVNYTDGETLSTKGLVLTVKYNDGATATITSGYSVSGFDTNKIGLQTVKVEYMGKSTSFSVRVRADFVPFETIEFNGHIYSFYDEDLSYTEAKEKCEAMGGHLVTVNSAEEQKTLHNVLKSGARNKYWIGLDDIDTNAGKYSWVTSESLSYTNWISDQPNANSGTNAVIIQSAHNGGWNDVSVNYEGEIGFICEINADEFEPVATKTYSNNTYYVFDSQITFSDAKALCEMLGGHLVTITSKGENDFVKALVKNEDADSYWLGAHNLNGSYEWVTGEKFSYTSWLTGNPDDTNSCEHFIEISDEYSYGWNDVKNLGRDSVVTGFVLEVESFEITLNSTDISLHAGYNTQLIATVDSSVYTAKDIKWKSSNNDIAKVSGNGVVTAVSSGSALIFAEINGITAYCKVTVIGQNKYDIVAMAVETKSDETDEEETTTSD